MLGAVSVRRSWAGMLGVVAIFASSLVGVAAVSMATATPAAALTTGPVAAAQMTAGEQHTCIRLPDTTARCWGDNAEGALGDGSRSGSTSPVTVVGLSGITRIVAGRFATCALLADGTVDCWGANAEGQLGNGTTNTASTRSPQQLVPTPVPGVAGAVAIESNYSNTCVILGDATVKCWGWNQWGQAGVPIATNIVVNATTVAGLSNATSVSPGGDHTCATRSDGTAWCWGRNNTLQLGGSGPDSSTPVQVPGIADAVHVATTGFGGCAILGDRSVSCWGNNLNGQLGRGFASAGSSGLPAGPVPGITDVRTLDGNGQGACATKANGEVWCWGTALGNGGAAANYLPVKPTGMSGATANAGGTSYACALKAVGTAWCWGSNASGQIGNNTAATATTPKQVSLNAFDQAPVVFADPTSPTVSLGLPATIAATVLGNPAPTFQWERDDGTGYAAIAGATSTTFTIASTVAADDGDRFRVVATNSQGTVTTEGGTLSASRKPLIATNPADLTVLAGDGVSFTASATGSPAPSVTWERSDDAGATWDPVPGATSDTLGFTSQATDDGARFRAVFTNDDGSTATAAATLTVDLAPAALGVKTQDVELGGDATFTVTPVGQPTPSIQWQVDYGDGGGFGDLVGETGPTLVVGGVTSAENEFRYRAVVVNRRGQAISDPGSIHARTPAGDPAPPFSVSPQIAVGARSKNPPRCAVLVQGTVRCWGNSTAPTPVTQYGLTGVTQLAGSCALTNRAVVWCWGDNQAGQLGRGYVSANTSSNPLDQVPAAVPGLADVVAISGGGSASTGSNCALRANGEVWCWGYLGAIDGNLEGAFQRPSPVKVPGIGPATQVSTGTTHSCAVLADHTLWCWGTANGAGQLGDGTTTTHYAPAPVSGITSAESVEAGSNTTCVLLSSHVEKCWGDNVNGGLGNGTELPVWHIPGGTGLPFYTYPADWSTRNTRVPDLPVVMSDIDRLAGPGCAISTSDALKCWGLADRTGSEFIGTTVPATIPNVGSVHWASGTAAQGCAIRLDGVVKCWGTGYLGNGVNTNSGNSSGVTVSGLTYAPGSLIPRADADRAVISTDPSNTTVLVGAPASFTAHATSVLPTTVQWERSDDGSTWDAVPGATSDTLTLATTSIDDQGARFRAVYTNADGSTTTAVATLTIDPGSPPSITLSPGPVTLVVGDLASFTAHAAAYPAGTVQWERSDDAGATWSPIVGATSDTYSFTTVAGDEGARFRAVFTNAVGMAVTTSATLTVDLLPTTSAPGDQTIVEDGDATFTVAVGGRPTPAIQWQVDYGDGGGWGDLPGETGTTLLVPQVSNAQDGFRYRALVENRRDTVVSDVAVLRVTKPGGAPVDPFSATPQIESGGRTDNPPQCALLVGGTLRCWGRSTSPVPTTLHGLSGVTQLGGSCALTDRGVVWCWGDNQAGQLGRGYVSATNNSHLEDRVPAPVPGLADVVEITGGGSTDAGFNCALRGNGEVWCWGYVGPVDGNLEGPFERSVPVLMPGLTDVVAIDSGISHTCAIRSDQSVWCWGTHNGRGQLGDGTTLPHYAPMPVLGLSGAIDLALGNSTSCALLQGGVEKCWGDDLQGGLGNGLESPVFHIGSYLPYYTYPADWSTRNTRVPNLPVAMPSIARLGGAGCAIDTSDVLRCWGMADRTGDEFVPASTPIEIPGVGPVQSANGTAANGCAIQLDGLVKCWGTGWLGNGVQTSSGDSTGVTVADLEYPAAAMAPPIRTVWGENATFTVTNSWGTAGTVSFYDGSTLLAKKSIASTGSASLVTKTLSVSVHTITASYQRTSTSLPVPVRSWTHRVGPARTTTTLSSSANPSVTGQAVRITARVLTQGPGTGVATGSVTFSRDGVVLGTKALSSGSALWTLSPANALSTITATYSGSTNFVGSIATPLAQLWQPADTATTMTVSPVTSVFGQSVSIRATVKAVSPGSGVVAGTVDLYDGATLVATKSLASGAASIVLKPSVGPHSYWASFAGSATYNRSTAPAVGQTVNPAGTAVTLTSTYATAPAGSSGAVVARVAARSPGAGVPSGSIDLYDNGSYLTTITLVAGKASIPLASLAPGSHALTGSYGGDVNFAAGASSAPLVVTIT